MSRRPGHTVKELGIRTRTESQAKRLRRVLREWDGPRDVETLAGLAVLALRMKGAWASSVCRAFKVLHS